MGGSDEEAERQRRERERMSLLDRLHGSKPRKAADGTDDMRSKRRTGRVVPMLFRAHPRVKQMILAIMDRDAIPSMPVLLEVLLEAYLKQYGPIDESLLPTEEELVERLEKERDRRDGY